VGSIFAAAVVLQLPQVGGLAGLFEHPDIRERISLLPDFTDTSILMTVFIIPLTVQWWSVWYPGAEPGGGGYIAQRMLAAKNESHAMGATLLFNIAHYVLRPWPWIIVGLASIAVFPDLEALRTAYPDMPPAIVKHDLAYPAMLTFLPPGLLGLVIASLMAAVMSTISTHLNWGASYVVNDFYRRFICRQPSERNQVRVGRATIVVLMALAAVLALFLENALQAFQILLQIGAGTGLLFLLRWFWWRINAYSEITAMAVSFLVALYFEFIHQSLGYSALEDWQKLTIGVGITTCSWVFVTLATGPAEQAVLARFCRKVYPGGPGWRRVIETARREGEDLSDTPGRGWDVPRGILNVFLGSIMIYSSLFTIGFWLYGNPFPAVITAVAAIISTLFLMRHLRRS